MSGTSIDMNSGRENYLAESCVAAMLDIVA